MPKVLKYARRSAQSGQSIVIVALVMISLLAFVVLGIDGGKFYTQRRTSQNASDMASLAGMQKYYNSPTTSNNQVVLKEIQRIAELNFVADTDGTPANGVNANVEAWWINSAGDYVKADNTIVAANTDPPPAGAVITNDPSAFKPAAAQGVRVRTHIPYVTFIGGVIGQSNLVAQADAASALTVGIQNFPGNQTSGDLGGSDCDNLDTKIAYVFDDIQNVTFETNVHIDGSLAVGNYNPGTTFGADSHGPGTNVFVRTMAGTGPAGGPYLQISPYNYNPLTGTNHSAFTNYTGPTGPYVTSSPAVAAPTGFSDTWYKTIGGVKTQIDASFWSPVAPTGYFYDYYVNNYLTTDFKNTYFGGSAAPLPSAFFTYINGGSKTANRTAVDNAISSGKRGIYYVVGDVTLSDTPDGVTVIATGKVDVTTNNFYWHTAGPLAMNISVLAGFDPALDATYTTHTSPNPALLHQRCATDIANAVLDTTGGQQVHWTGIVYVPYGQAYFGGNFDNNLDHCNGPIVAYSMHLGAPDGHHPDQNQCFNLNVDGYQVPSLVIKLKK